jgi:hypothetical protein
VICEADGVLDKCPTKHHRWLSDAEGAEGIGRGYQAAVGADAENLLNMRRAIILSVVLAAGAVALVFAYLEMSKERKLEAAREKPVATKSRTSFGTNGEAVVTLDEETQKRIALKVQPVAPGTITPELKGYPLVGSTLTPVVVFIPLAFLEGLAGVFFRALAMTMVVSLLMSLVLAITLRPAYQNPGGAQAQQAALAVGESGDGKHGKSGKKLGKLAWPKTMAERVMAVSGALGGVKEAVTAADVANGFSRAKAADAGEILETLCAVGRAHKGKVEGAYLP